MKNLPHISLAIVIGACLLLTDCKKREEVTDKLHPYVVQEAAPILAQEKNLATFRVVNFTQDPDIDNDQMDVQFEEFAPSKTNVEPDTKKDEDPTLNDLGWTLTKWDEKSTHNWTTGTDPNEAPYNESRSYRVLKDNELSNPQAGYNSPTYETIDDNIYERSLGTTFVWDLGDLKYPDGTKQYEATFEFNESDDISTMGTFPNPLTQEKVTLLEKAGTWAEDIDSGTPTFTTGATIYGASRSVAADSIVMEAVRDDSADSVFSLLNTHFGNAEESIEKALDKYAKSGTERLPYRFTVDYYSAQRSFYLQFDTATHDVYFYKSLASTELIHTTYTLHESESYLEINMDGLNNVNDSGLDAMAVRKFLGIPAYFNPVIIGPFTEDGTESTDINDKYYFIGKHYIKTDVNNRKYTDPIFFLNQQARNDIKHTFKAWREQKHLDAEK